MAMMIHYFLMIEGLWWIRIVLIQNQIRADLEDGYDCQRVMGFLDDGAAPNDQGR